MEGQGVAASSAAAAGRQGETFATSGITDGGEGRGRNGDGSHVMVASGHPEASSQDDGMPQAPDSSPPPRPPGEMSSSPEPGGKASQESRTEFSSQRIKSDKADNIGDPDRDNGVVAKDENTGHNQAAGGLAPSAVDAPAADAPVADSPVAGDSAADDSTAAAAGSGPPSGSGPAAGSVPPETPGTGEPDG